MLIQCEWFHWNTLGTRQLPVSGVGMLWPISQTLNNDINTVGVAQFDTFHRLNTKQTQNGTNVLSCVMILIKQSPPPIHIYAAIMRKSKRRACGFVSKTAEVCFFLPQNIIFVYFFFTPVEIIVVRKKMRMDELIHSISHCIVENWVNNIVPRCIHYIVYRKTSWPRLVKRIFFI